MIPALLLLVTLQLIGLVALEKSMRQPTAFIWLLLIPFLMIPLLFEYVWGNSFIEATIFDAVAFMAIANFVYGGFLFLIKTYLPPVTEKPGYQVVFDAQKPNTLLYCFGIIGLLILGGVSADRIISSDLSDKRDLGLAYLVIMWLFCMLSGGIVYSLYGKNKIILLLAVPVVLIIMTYFRSRSLIAIVIISWVAIDIVFMRRGWKSIATVSMIGLLGLGASIILKATRYVGSLSNIVDVDLVLWNISYVTRELFKSGDFSIYKYMLYIFDRCEGLSFCGTGSIIQKILSQIGLASRPIQTFEYSLYDAYSEAGVGGSLHPTLYGIAYGDNGWLGGIAFFILLAGVNVGLARFYQGKRIFLYIGFLSYYIMFMARGSVYNALVTALVGIVLTIASGYLSRIGGSAKIAYREEEVRR